MCHSPVKLLKSVSKIFKWYGDDFEPAGGVVAFLELYAPPQIARRLEEDRARIKLAYQDYDWSLNSVAPPKDK